MNARAGAAGRAHTLRGLTLFGGLDTQWLEGFAAVLEPVHLRGGETLLRQGDPADALYVVVYGRLREHRRDTRGRDVAVRDVEAGEPVGERELLTAEPRACSVTALRDSVLLRLDAAAFQRLVAEHPPALMRITRAALGKLRFDPERRATRRSIAVLAAGDAAVPDDVVARLAHALARIGPTLVVTRATVERALGAGAAAAGPGSPRDADTVAWLHAAEQQHKFLLYGVDAVPDAWTQRALRQCDDVLLVACANASPAPNAVERFAAAPDAWLRRAERFLVVVREPGTAIAATSRWLDGRDVRAHDHVDRDRAADYERLARLLTGRAMGLALGGGAARGFAHVGVLRALEEAHVPVDTVTGASFGAVVAAGVARGWDHRAIEEKLRHAVVDQRSLLDFTLPVASLTTGRRLTHRLREAFGEVAIEDLDRRFACVSTDVTEAREHVHARGPVWRALRASTALPGIFPPVRGEPQRLLLDGSLVMDVPVGLSRRLGRGGRVLGVDLKAPVRVALDDLPDDGIVPGWPLWLTRLLPYRRRPRVPSLVHVLAAATMVGAASSPGANASDADLHLEPPVGHIGLLHFDRWAEAVEAGYRHAMERLPAWLDSGSPNTTRF